LITAAMFALAFAGALALSVDFGQLYVMKSLLQARADAAALAGAVQLDGTPKGLAEAEAAVRRMAGQPAGVQSEYSQTQTGPWAPAATASQNSRFVRVRVKSQASLFFMRVIDPVAAASIGATASAGQLQSAALERGLTISACSAGELAPRVAEDSDQESKSYEEYAAANKGNGRRIVLCTGERGVGAYFAGRGAGPAEWIGSYVLGSRRRGAAESGAFVVRLVQ
jgi:hypothetical protein